MARNKMSKASGIDKTINIKKYRKIVILTGAGVSEPSGLGTYRGQGGIWEKYNVNEYGSVDRVKDAPEKIWSLFGKLREKVINASPNEAHYVLARLEENMRSNQELIIITQNVDGLHQKAGSKNVIELHGNIHKTRCSNSICKLQPFEDEKNYIQAPLCVCGSPFIPNIVLFGEQLPVEAEHLAKRALRKCNLFVAVGTSGCVFPAANYVRSADYEGARTLYINLEPLSPPNPYFHKEIIGDAVLILGDMFDC